MGKIEPLTSLRFFAAALVVIGHAGFYPGFEAFKFQIINYSNAVSFFYVLSGFILFHSYKNLASKSEVKEFFIARFARVFPLHLATLIACLLIFGPNIFNGKANNYIPVFVTNLALIHAWIPEAKYYFSYNAVSWSVSVEAFFYMAFPALLFAYRRYGAKSLILPLLVPVAVSFVCVLYKIPLYGDGISSSALLYVNPISRLIEFSFGMLVYVAYERLGNKNLKSSVWTIFEVGILLLLLVSLLIAKEIWLALKFTDYSAFGYWYAIAGSFILFGGVVFVFAYKSGAISSVLSKKIFVYLGEISFSVYMCHQIVLNYFNVYYLEVIKVNPVTMYMVYWAVTLIVSMLLYHVVEVPARKAIRGMLSRRQVTA